MYHSCGTSVEASEAVIFSGMRIQTLTTSAAARIRKKCSQERYFWHRRVSDGRARAYLGSYAAEKCVSHLTTLGVILIKIGTELSCLWNGLRTADYMGLALTGAVLVASLLTTEV